MLPSSVIPSIAPVRQFVVSDSRQFTLESNMKIIEGRFIKLEQREEAEKVVTIFARFKEVFLLFVA
jgi:hypothetical protein